MATRFDTMVMRLAEVRAMNMHSDPDTVATVDAPSWVRGMLTEGWIEEYDIGVRGSEDWFPGWRVTVYWKETLRAHREAKRSVGRPRMARFRVVSFALLCPECSAELARGSEAEWPQAQRLTCVCGYDPYVPHREIEAAFKR
jgi:hypothetical protein